MALVVTGEDDIYTNFDCDGLECSGFGQRIGIPSHGLDGNEYQAVMSYGGISFAQSRREGDPIPVVGTADATEVLSYGGWLDHHFFGIQATYDGTTEDAGQVGLAAYTFGKASGSNPDSGSGAWYGVAVGVNGASDFANRNPITADVTVSIDDFLNPMMEVVFNNVRDLSTGEGWTVSGFPISTISWDSVEVAGGSFDQLNNEDTARDDFSNPRALRNRIAGQFYGPNHEEVGGIFEYATVVGSFGAKR